jgi:hypothetical protein
VPDNRRFRTLEPLNQESKVPKAVIADVKLFWGGVVLVSSIFLAGGVFRDKLKTWVFGGNAEARILSVETRQQVLDAKYEHLHEEIRDTRDDLRSMQSGVRLPPLTIETPWPEPTAP